MNINRVRAVIIRHIYNFKHNLDRLSDCFYWPAMDLILWGLTSQYIQESGKDINKIVLILLSGLIFWQVVWRSQYEITTGFLEELWSQNLVNIFSTALTVNEWVTGVLILGVIKMIITITFAGFLSWLLYSVSLFTFGWLLLPFFANLLMTGWWVGLIVSGILVQFGRQLQTLAWSGVYLLAPFSAIYYPVSSLPVWAQIIAKFLPTSYVFEGMREVLITGKMSYINLAISFLLNSVYLFISYLFFKWSFKKSKEKGLARLE